MNKKTVALTSEQYHECIRLLREGFELNGRNIRPNYRIATIMIVEASLGLRIGDVLKLKLSSFVKDGYRHRLDIKEEKTGKTRVFTVPIEVFSFIQDYAIGNGVSKDVRLFNIGERQVERHLKLVFEKMELDTDYYGTHSFRKFFATQVYNNNDFNVLLVQKLLQHSSPNTTQRYIGIDSKSVENALEQTKMNII